MTLRQASLLAQLLGLRRAFPLLAFGKLKWFASRLAKLPLSRRQGP
jgi:hypothetical protein